MRKKNVVHGYLLILAGFLFLFGFSDWLASILWQRSIGIVWVEFAFGYFLVILEMVAQRRPYQTLLAIASGAFAALLAVNYTVWHAGWPFYLLAGALFGFTTICFIGGLLFSDYSEFLEVIETDPIHG